MVLELIRLTFYFTMCFRRLLTEVEVTSLKPLRIVAKLITWRRKRLGIWVIRKYKFKFAFHLEAFTTLPFFSFRKECLIIVVLFYIIESCEMTIKPIKHKHIVTHENINRKTMG